MSRQNKVNPGMYTQRGRLTQDDAARELKKQRVIGSEHTWQPVQRDQMPQLTSEPDDTADDQALDEQDTEDQETADAPTAVEKQPARAKAVKPASAKAAKPAARSAKPAPRRPAKTAARKTAAKKATTATKRGKAKAAKPAAKRGAAKTARKAVLARNVGGGGSKPKPTAKRR